MSSTRHAAPGAPFRQERYMSGSEFERGLLANVVSSRCSLVRDETARDLIWFVQYLSWRDGGLAKLAEELLAAHPERVVSKKMRECGVAPGQIYSAEQVRQVRWEIPQDDCTEELLARADNQKSANREDDEDDERADPAGTYSGCPASMFVERCAKVAGAELPQYLAELCVNPLASVTTGPWYFAALIESLREYQTAWIADRRVHHVVTSIATAVHAALDYALKGRGMAMVTGMARTGKTFATKAWCELHPGRVRYVVVPATSDDLGFYRAIAKALGVSAALSMTTIQLRERIQDAVVPSGLMLVFDESHNLWPTNTRRDTTPRRICWLTNALVDHGVPVALITTPQFHRSQDLVIERTRWSDEQFTGRCSYYKRLPDKVSPSDLEAVARHLLPEGCARSIELLTRYAAQSGRQLAAIGDAVNYARVTASEAARNEVVFSDVREAVQSTGIASDADMQAARDSARGTGKRRAMRPATAPEIGPAKAACNAPERPLQTHENLLENQPVPDDFRRADVVTA